MNLTELREAVATALSAIPEVASGEWTVAAAPTDAIQPPAFVLDWGPDPWRTTQTMCADVVQLEVIAVAARLSPEANYPILEALVDSACNALATARLRSPQTLGPAPLELGNITYLAARVLVRQSVEVTLTNA